MTKIIFFGSSDYCLPVLTALAENFKLASIISKPLPNPVYNFAVKSRTPVFTPFNVAQLSVLKHKLASLKPDLAVVADYGLIIPEEIFTLPEHKTLNIHFSRLPQFRGPSPVQYSILFGMETSWVSIILMSQKVDNGPIIKQLKYNVPPASETAQSLYSKLFQSVSAELPEIILNYINKKIAPVVQNEKMASYTRKLNRNDGFLPFEVFKKALLGSSINSFPENTLLNRALQKSDNLARTIDNAVRAFDPWPGVWTILPNVKRLKILKSHLHSVLIPDLVQLEGKKPVEWKQLKEGYPDILAPTSSITANNSL